MDPASALLLASLCTVTPTKELLEIKEIRAVVPRSAVSVAVGEGAPVFFKFDWVVIIQRSDGTHFTMRFPEKPVAHVGSRLYFKTSYCKRIG